jgi:type 1 glutamine amidotransferase
VTIEPRSGHPLTKEVAAFTVRDEHYFMAMNDVAVDVFLHSRSEHGVQPAGWTRSEGEGRVCVLTPGHNLEVWLHPSFQKLLLNALRWSAKLN